MKQIFTFFLCFLLGITLLLGQTNPKHSYVNGYYRKDGTYVLGHYKTTPNNTNRDNFSTKGNVNPYTGQPGWIQPDNKGKYQSNPINYSYNDSLRHYDQTPKYFGKTNSSGQKIITYSNGQEIFGLCSYCSNITYNEETYYYWYTPYAGVQKTKGDAGGTLLDGKYEFYNEDGKLLLKTYLIKGVLNGDYFIWDENGDIIDKLRYTNGELVYAKYLYENNYFIEWIGEMFKQGTIKNVYTKYGTLIETSTQIEDFKFQYRLYYKVGGQLEFEFTKGMFDTYYGSYKEYFQNGNPRVIGQYTDAIQDGLWEYFDEDSLIDTKTFRIYIEKDIYGKLKIKGGQYYDPKKENWVKTGRWIYYMENGNDWADVKYFKDGVEK